MSDVSLELTTLQRENENLRKQLSLRDRKVTQLERAIDLLLTTIHNFCTF